MKLLWIILAVLISACSSKPPLTIYKNDEQMVLKDSFVDLPMPFIYPSMENQNYIRCFKEQFCSLFPVMKDIDFKDGRFWGVMTSNNSYSIYTAEKIPINQQQAINDYVNYSIHLSSYISPYSAKDRALENGDEEFLRKYYNSYVGKITINKEVEQKPLYLEHYGKENYPCEVREFLRPLGTYGMQVETYYKRISCLKSNSEKTMAKTVSIELIYTKAPTFPKELESLSKEYTYEDLQERAKRMLDSLYIKDGWDE
ncbi:hypothetical protein [Aliarcobacter butzleri]|uniref:hypothetical protein n=1 Tax=Aliarcobacter butzleri TaxID=28197 RepID=UPI002B24C1A2|nr:hypothetical protein [Aliarcobacter butzleri]